MDLWSPMSLQAAMTPCHLLNESMTRTLSVATYVHTINLTKDFPICTQCTRHHAAHSQLPFAIIRQLIGL